MGNSTPSPHNSHFGNSLHYKQALLHQFNPPACPALCFYQPPPQPISKEDEYFFDQEAKLNFFSLRFIDFYMALKNHIYQGRLLKEDILNAFKAHFKFPITSLHETYISQFEKKYSVGVQSHFHSYHKINIACIVSKKTGKIEQYCFK